MLFFISENYPNTQFFFLFNRAQYLLINSVLQCFILLRTHREHLSLLIHVYWKNSHYVFRNSDHLFSTTRKNSIWQTSTKLIKRRSAGMNVSDNNKRF